MGYLILLTFIVCIVGCFWAHIPLKKSVFVLLVAPVFSTGSIFMLIAASGFITKMLVVILGKLGVNIYQYADAIMWTILGIVLMTLLWIFFSNEREINLRMKKRASDRRIGPVKFDP